MSPRYAGPLLRGVYCDIINGVPTDINGDPHTNLSVAGMLNGLPPMVGALTIGNPKDEDCATLTKAGLEFLALPKLSFWAWDVRTSNPMPFSERLYLLRSYAGASGRGVGMVYYKLIDTDAELEDFKAKQLLIGFPDIVTIDPEETACLDLESYWRQHDLP